MRAKYGEAFEIIFQKKFWPHIDGTGGFFVAKIRKLQSLEINQKSEDTSETTEKEWRKSEIKKQSDSNKELKLYRGNISPWKTQADIELYEHENKILAIRNSDVGDKIRDAVFLMRYGEQIGVVDHGRFSVSNRAWRYLDTSETEQYTITDIQSLDLYLRGEPIENTGIDSAILVIYQDQVLGLEYRK
jgi:hypothetical protein